MQQLYLISILYVLGIYTSCFTLCKVCALEMYCTTPFNKTMFVYKRVFYIINHYQFRMTLKLIMTKQVNDFRRNCLRRR